MIRCKYPVCYSNFLDEINKYIKRKEQFIKRVGHQLMQM